MNLQTSALLSNRQIAGVLAESIERTAESNRTSTRESTGNSFGQILSGKVTEIERSKPLKFSKHASLRMSDRGMDMTQQQLDRLKSGTVKAAEKGIKDGLVLVDDMAFIVNVPSSTVITAIDQKEGSEQEQIFTNINGAVIA